MLVLICRRPLGYEIGTFQNEPGCFLFIALYPACRPVPPVGVQDMMHGTLEVKQDALTADAVKKPEWMEEVAAEDMTEEQKKVGKQTHEMSIDRNVTVFVAAFLPARHRRWTEIRRKFLSLCAQPPKRKTQGSTSHSPNS